MPRPYPPEFRARAIALVREGRQAKQTAANVGIHEVTVHSWLALRRKPGSPSRAPAQKGLRIRGITSKAIGSRRQIPVEEVGVVRTVQTYDLIDAEVRPLTCEGL